MLWELRQGPQTDVGFHSGANIRMLSQYECEEEVAPGESRPRELLVPRAGAASAEQEIMSSRLAAGTRTKESGTAACTMGAVRA